jgi:ABC-type lipoprotein release transport system permease subunit
MLFAVSWFDPRTLAGVVILVVGVALVSTFGPARRAARLDPMAVLRE